MLRNDHNLKLGSGYAFDDETKKKKSEYERARRDKVSKRNQEIRKRIDALDHDAVRQEGNRILKARGYDINDAKYGDENTSEEERLENLKKDLMDYSSYEKSFQRMEDKRKRYLAEQDKKNARRNKVYKEYKADLKKTDPAKYKQVIARFISLQRWSKWYFHGQMMPEKITATGKARTKKS